MSQVRVYGSGRHGPQGARHPPRLGVREVRWQRRHHRQQRQGGRPRRCRFRRPRQGKEHKELLGCFLQKNCLKVVNLKKNYIDGKKSWHT